ncbi:hypothetical protein JK386_09650 [Nocardioides sp. zg-536]|uniref:Uncharacterized protein n=1 Tax=Nocardioides faecalis TaxID=2803858 RepID=A0A939BYB3_9ACTN|nr:hypothetical protein [Nocardioides faecalis]MBM9460168.1 hypothetical protein [Nocardioides faecalis]QVI60037.1 hypothetical protein KG111_06955 [Nocardioides faecalis]
MSVRVLRVLAWFACVATTSTAFWLLTRSRDVDFDVPMLLVLGAHVMLGWVLHLSVEALDVRRTAMGGAMLGGFGALLAELAIGFLMFPATLRDGEIPDRSWFLVVPFVLLLGFAAFLLGVLLVRLLLAPAVTLVRRGRAALGGDVDARDAVLWSLLLLVTVAWATATALALPSEEGRARLLPIVLLLLGVRGQEEAHQGALWAGRVLSVLLVLVGVALFRFQRRLRAAAAEPDPSDPHRGRGESAGKHADR